MKRELFLISQVFYPDEVSTAGLFTNLCETIAADGYHVEVWSAHPSYSTRKRMPRRVVFNGITIHYLPSTNFPKDSIAGRLANTLTFSASVFFRLLFCRDKGIVFTHTTPPPLGIMVSFICRLKGMRFIYVLLDIFPEGMVRLGKVSSHNILVKLWQSLFIKSLMLSTHIIVLGRDMKRWLYEIKPELDDRVLYIPHWQNEKIHFHDDFNSNELILSNGLQEKFVVQYSGNMGLWNDMKTIGITVNNVPDDVSFMFVGGGVRKSELLEGISPENMGKALFLSFQPSGNLGVLLKACHAALVSLRQGVEGMAVPSKIYGILAAGIPVIAIVPHDSEIAMIVEEEKCGIVIEPGDHEALLKAIMLLKSDRITREMMGRNGRSAFEKKYTTGIISRRYTELLEKNDSGQN